MVLLQQNAFQDNHQYTAVTRQRESWQKYPIVNLRNLREGKAPSHISYQCLLMYTRQLKIVKQKQVQNRIYACFVLTSKISK